MNTNFEHVTHESVPETPLAQAGKLLRETNPSFEVMEQVWNLFVDSLPEGKTRTLGCEIGRPILEMEPEARRHLITPEYISERIDHYTRALTSEQRQDVQFDALRIALLEMSGLNASESESTS
jgi:hypothetical protein